MLPIPTAQEARMQVDELQSKTPQEKVAEAIQRATHDLKTECPIDGVLPQDLIKELEGKGYTIKLWGPPTIVLTTFLGNITSRLS